MAHASEQNKAKRSYETELLEFTADIVNNMQAGQQTDVCILDFVKAFDKVDHHRLVKKLNWYGINGEMNRWIHNFQSNRTQTVVIDGATSGTVPVVSGVPQESVPCPSLFLVY